MSFYYQTECVCTRPMLFSGRHLAQCVIVWSRCSNVMVSEVCLKLRKWRKVGGNWEWQQRTFWSKGTCIISFCIWHHFLSEAKLSSHRSNVDANRGFTNGLPGMISLTTAPTVFRHAVMSGKGSSRHHLLQRTQFSLCRWDPTCFQRTFSLSGSALWPEGSHYTQLANRRFLLLNTQLMCLTNSSSQATSTLPVCLRVMAYVTPGQILNKVCLSQLLSLCWWETLRGQSVITATDGLSVYLAYCSD